MTVGGASPRWRAATDRRPPLQSRLTLQAPLTHRFRFDVADVLRGLHIDRVFGDICGVVADALDVAGDENQVEVALDIGPAPFARDRSTAG